MDAAHKKWISKSLCLDPQDQKGILCNSESKRQENRRAGRICADCYPMLRKRVSKRIIVGFDQRT